MFKLAGDMGRPNQREINHVYNNVTDSVENRRKQGWRKSIKRARRRLCCGQLSADVLQRHTKKKVEGRATGSISGRLVFAWLEQIFMVSKGILGFFYLVVGKISKCLLPFH